MDWTPIYVIVIFIVLLIGVLHDSWSLRVVCLILIIGLAHKCTTDEDLIKARVRKAAEEQREDKICREPKLESSVDGVALYSFKEGCYAEKIYFSKSGTQTERCKTHMVGKIMQTRCENLIVPNAQEQKQ